MAPGLKIFHRGLILVGVPFVLGLLLIGGLSVLLYESDRDQLQESVYRKIAAVNARILLLTVETPYYLISSIRFGSDDIYQIYESKHDEFRKNQVKLIRLLKKTPDLADGANEIQENIETVMRFTEGIAADRKGNLPGLIMQVSNVMDSFEQEKKSALEHLSKMMRAGEIRTREMEEKQARIRRQQSLLLAAGILANLAAGVLLALFFRAGIARRLNIISQNTIALSGGGVIAEPLAGSDEIAQLDQAFHAMDHDLKQAARRERELFENASDVICVLDYADRFQKVNRAASRVWGYSPEELGSMTLTQILHDDDCNAFADQVARGKLTGEPFTFENRMVRAGGAQIETSWSAFWSQLDRQLYCVVHDITERKATERMKQKFLAMVSSDLKRPLSAMSACVSILAGSESGGLPPMAVDKLKVTGKNLQRLLGLVNDLLQITELESTGIDIKKEWCDGEELLVRSLQEVEAVAVRQGVKLEALTCQLQWLVDPNRIVQVLVNLLSNAIKFSPAGETVILSAEQRGDMIEVRVKDRGRGVPESHRAAIFEKFKQVEAADGKRKSGTGLGLPICKQIVEDHGGSIGVESSEGEGSTFWFQIPRDETVSMKIKLASRKEIEEQENTESQTAQAAETAQAAQNDQTAQNKFLPDGSPIRKEGLQGLKEKLSGNIRLGVKGAILVGLPLVFELILVGTMSAVLFQVDHVRKDELHFRNIAFQTSKLSNMYFVMAMGAISEAQEKDWVLFREGYESSRRTLSDLEKLCKNDRSASNYLSIVRSQEKSLAEWVHTGEKYLEKYGRTNVNFRRAMGGKERMLPSVMKINRSLEKLCDESEKKEFVSPERQKTLRLRQIQILICGLAANVAGSLALALFFSTDIVSRLQILADNAMRLAREKPLNALLAGKDEIAVLDRTFHETAAALAEARKKERAVFDNSQDVICALNAQGCFVSVNPAAEKLWAYKKDELVGRRFADMVAAESARRVVEVLETGADSRGEIELSTGKKDGVFVQVLWSYARTAPEGDIACVVHDITAIKELERIKQEFLAMVSHDLRTPLTSILGITKLILAGAFGTVEERARGILERISRSGDQLLELINDLLDIEKLEAGKMQLVLEEVNLIEVVRLSVSTARDKARVVLELDNLPEPIYSKADRDRLQQAIVNVLNYFLDASTSTVMLSAAAKDGMLEIIVSAGAALLSQKALESLFDRFATVAGLSVSEAGSGSGLALPVAAKIIESHGGIITVVAEERSATIKMAVPLLSAS
jgi:PAS domain S-box-containing protein